MKSLNYYKRYYLKRVNNFINKTFFPSTAKVKQGIRTFIDKQEHQLNNYGIYSIKVRKGFNGITHVYIVSNMPGIIIGKGGTNIDNLKDYLKERLKTDISIHLKEYSVWNGTFDELFWEKRYQENMDDYYSLND